MGTLESLKISNQAPEWLSYAAFKTLSNGYLLNGEAPRQMYERVAKASSKYLKKPELESKFFNYMWKNWLCPSTPVAANSGTDRALPISCFGSTVPDSVVGIMDTMKEIGILSKAGGGTSAHWHKVRGRGSKITGNGISDGIIPFNKILDSTIIGISQGGVRRGSCASYLPVTHPDIDEFIDMRKPSGDVNRQCLNLHHGVTIPNEWMEKVIKSDGNERKLWLKIMKSRWETGEPYLFFSDHVNNTRPDCYKSNNLIINGSNLCNEIRLFSDEDHTFVCCLSSLNLAKWDEWKDDNEFIKTCVWFLDGIMEEFIQKTDGIIGLEKARRFAIKSRSVGVGVLGFHTLLQQKMFAFDSIDAYLLNNIIFKKIKTEADLATAELAKEYGEPEWATGFNRRNCHCLAIAPTVSNSLISSNVSAGIEPWAANAFAQKSAKGNFIIKNKTLENLFESKHKNTEEVWASIIKNSGSVQHLNFLDKEEKEVFLTAREINQFAIVKLASARQKYIDQGQSLNLFFPANSDPKYVNDIHLELYKSGLHGAYYLRTESVLKSDSGSREYKRESTECKMCEG